MDKQLTANNEGHMGNCLFLCELYPFQSNVTVNRSVFRGWWLPEL